MPRIYVALDLETTGLQAERDAIIEIGAVKFRGDEILGEWSSLINPGRPLPHKIARLTGIHPREVERAPALAQVLPRLAHFIGDLPVVGHNIQFDCNFLQRAGLNISAALDTFELACILMPYASRYTLGRLMDALGIRFVHRHRAVEDARAVSQLFVALLARAQQLDPSIIEEIADLGKRAQWPLHLAFQDILHARARYAFAAGSIGAQLAAKNATTNDSLGLLFLRDPDERPLKPKMHTDPLDVDALAHLLEPEGLFARRFDGYEFRAPQIEMLRAVARAFNDGATLLVEAGTGTGKSLAYLIPAIYWAAQNNHRVVISTNTINLQDQLFTKDIPDVRRVVPVEFRAALLKGRSNYLCRKRFDQMRQSRTLTAEQARVLAKVLAWLPSTTTGDNAELMLIGQAENAVWAQLASDPDHCTADQCERRMQGKCFFYRAREQAERAHILIVNHALLLSDLITENHVLPEFKYLIVDEAHHLEESATKAFAFEASRASLDTMLRALAHERGGLLGMLAGATRNSEAPPNLKRETQRLLDDAAQDVERAVRGVYDFYNALENFVARQEANPNENESGYDRQIRLTPARRSQPDWNQVELAWDAFGRSLVQVRKGLERIYAAWDDLSEWEVPSYLELAAELTGAMRRIEETRAQLEAIISKPRANGIYWVTLAKNNGDVTLHSAPLYVGDLLQKQLFADKNTTILTSATLCVDKSFTHIKARLGIGDWADELAVGSPFDFAKAALLCVPTDMPEPGQPGYQKAVESFLVELLRATQGRALVLFTSISQLNSTYRAITRPLEEDEIVVLAQNLDGSRRQVLETFKTQARTALLGTRSFWEGVDVVGEALSCLVITRLPFSVPSDPIFAARSETFDDPFNQYAVPEAVLRFRQGFGRLIRSKTDRGVVVLLDRRILSKSYGRVFLESLPPVSKYQGTLKELPDVAAKWIAPQ
ncbi:MAG: exonuclease domain-containing protein [Anaerolineae bacterium]|nr:exonuclease domain-containing protein [Anaerolineae bacterium]